MYRSYLQLSAIAVILGSVDAMLGHTWSQHGVFSTTHSPSTSWALPSYCLLVGSGRGGEKQELTWAWPWGLLSFAGVEEGCDQQQLSWLLILAYNTLAPGLTGNTNFIKEKGPGLQPSGLAVNPAPEPEEIS